MIACSYTIMRMATSTTMTKRKRKRRPARIAAHLLMLMETVRITPVVVGVARIIAKKAPVARMTAPHVPPVTRCITPDSVLPVTVSRVTNAARLPLPTIGDVSRGVAPIVTMTSKPLRWRWDLSLPTSGGIAITHHTYK